jgi:hypothetical protein
VIGSRVFPGQSLLTVRHEFAASFPSDLPALGHFVAHHLAPLRVREMIVGADSVCLDLLVIADTNQLADVVRKRQVAVSQAWLDSLKATHGSGQ